jgi:hypothetical protein
MLQAYEKGIALFKWPNVFNIWNTYLTKFLKRYGGTKLERARDLFEQCLENCPPKFAKGKCHRNVYAEMQVSAKLFSSYATVVEVIQNCVTGNFVTHLVPPPIIFIEKFVIKVTLMPLSLASIFVLGKYNQSLL